MSTTHPGTSIKGFPGKASLSFLGWDTDHVTAVIITGKEKRRERWDVEQGTMKVDNRGRLAFLLVPTPALRADPAITRGLHDVNVTVSKMSFSKGKS